MAGFLADGTKRWHRAGLNQGPQPQVPGLLALSASGSSLNTSGEAHPPNGTGITGSTFGVNGSGGGRTIQLGFARPRKPAGEQEAKAEWPPGTMTEFFDLYLPRFQ